MILRSILLALASCAVFNVYAQPTLSFYEYVKQLEAQLVENGSDANQTKLAFNKVKLFKKAVVVQQRARKKVESLDTYLPRLVNPQRVKKARALYKKHLPLLKDIEKKYNIQPRFIVALWGVANDFSSEVDGYNALSVLSSLAYANQNNPYYHIQVLSTINSLNTKAIGFANIKSNWAGRLGLFNLSSSQYLTSYQDYNNDGKVDIWRSIDDSFATTAKFLKDSGWQHKYTWGRQVRLPKAFDDSLIVAGEYQTLSKWKTLGITRFDYSALPSAQIKARLVAPDGNKGRIYLTYKNFEYLLKLNDSLYKAVAVGYLSNRIKYPPIK
jgi:membrane-bound lytic murein transglycosylase B